MAAADMAKSGTVHQKHTVQDCELMMNPLKVGPEVDPSKMLTS